MPEITFNIDVYCGTCGEGLCSTVTVDKRGSFRVPVCYECMGKKEDEIIALEDKIQELEEKE